MDDPKIKEAADRIRGAAETISEPGPGLGLTVERRIVRARNERGELLCCECQRALDPGEPIWWHRLWDTVRHVPGAHRLTRVLGVWYSSLNGPVCGECVRNPLGGCQVAVAARARCSALVGGHGTFRTG